MNKLKILYKIICVQKLSSGGVLKEKCSGNIKQIHRRANMKKHDLNNIVIILN